ncbi:MAG: hypothetical protein IR164_13335 [Devosia sp.]|uniref:glycoside hydrolase family 19 protein n=1 Tax=Devosia sp. TaxID=1871048 RepID=UPI0019EB4CB1|nr:glycoside hydrolase family 19 protein [Devosia sp.]MBF0679909.1 hypothetical protein [Devosia sp.]
MANNTAFFNAVRSSLFGGKLSQSQVDGINAVIAAWHRSGDTDDRKLAYLLATTFLETGQTMQPIHERGARSYFDKYEPGTKIGKSLGNTNIGDGYRFRGRGYVQITGRFNYRNAGLKMDVDLLSNPDKALDPVIAGMALVRGSLEGWYTGKKLGDYINASHTDYINARRVINGTDKATLIAGYADKFEQALALIAAQPAGGGSTSPAPKPSPVPTSGLPEPAKPGGFKPAGIIAAIIILAALAAAIFFVRF